MTRDTGASEPVGTLHAIVLDVNDLESCVGFWSEVLGKETSFKADKYCRMEATTTHPLCCFKRYRSNTNTRTGPTSTWMSQI